MDKTKYAINVGGESLELSLPTTKNEAIATLAAAKYNVGKVISEREDSEEAAAKYNEYRAWHTACVEEVNKLDLNALNKAANEQIEEEQKKAEDEEKRLEPIRRFEEAKANKLSAIDAYDKSDNVNGFSINGIGGWLDRDTRTSLVNTINVEMAAGMEQTTLWFDTNALTLPCDLVLQMLGALEMYAHQCYNVTAQHKANVMAMEAIEAIEAYDHTEGYPEKLIF